MEISEETLLANFLTVDVTKAGVPVDRKLPIYSDDGFSEREYQEFWEFLDSKADQWFAYLNDEVFG